MVKRLLAALVAAALATGCSSPTPEPSPPVPADPEAHAVSTAPALLPFPIPPHTLRFTGRLTIDKERGDKQFQGVWIAREGGERHLVAYRADEVWRPWDGKQVEVAGEPYRPRGQAIRAPHLKVLALWSADPTPEDAVEWLGPEVGLRGRFVEDVGGPGTKLEGERWLVFEAAEGGRYLLGGERPAADRVGSEVSVRGRRYEPSRYTARMGGDYLWVLEVDAATSPESVDR